MLLRRLLSVVLFTGVVATAAADEVRRRPLGPEIERYLKADQPDMAHLAYICSRGAALLTAYSGTMQATGTTDTERELAAQLKKRAVPFFQVAILAAIGAREDPEVAQKRIVGFVEMYADMMTRSRNLSNDSINAPLRKDLDALRGIEAFVIRYGQKLDLEEAGRE
jgi:hypothetical protein